VKRNWTSHPEIIADVESVMAGRDIASVLTSPFKCARLLRTILIPFLALA
jgi:hypothetical protein